MMEIELKVQE